jgi:tripeptide aminopeptidase
MQTDVVKYFLELVAIDSESRNERAMADRITSDLEALGAIVHEDDCHHSTGGNAGNIFATIPGDISKPPILFCAHLDTVKPGNGIKAVIDGDRIRTDWTTVLGGDDKSGVAEIMWGIKQVLDSGAKHAPIEILFTVSEEIGLLGAKHFDKSRLQSAFGYALDSHRVGELVLAAPAQNSIKVKVCGKEAHAGVEPEKGINAIRVAAEAIASMPLGRIDHETTCNIGFISGGIATNIVPPVVELKGEARSHSMNKLDQVCRDMHHAMEQAVRHHRFDFSEARFEWEQNREYDSFCLEESDPVVSLALNALQVLDIPAETIKGGGGSDANIIGANGVPMLICGTGMNNVHTVQEDILVEELHRGANFIASMIRIYSA